jgi:ankyrin repeat protein
MRSRNLGRALALALAVPVSAFGAAQSQQSGGDGPALIRAARRGDVAEVTRLLDAGVEADFVLPDPHHLELTAIEFAALEGQCEVVALLARRGATLRSDGDRGLYAAGFAARSCGPDLIDLLWERASPMPDATALFGGALIDAARSGEGGVVERLLDRGIDPDWHTRSDPYPRPAVVEAAGAGHLAVAVRLVERGADPDPEPDLGGWTPLMFAAAAGDVAAVRLFLDRGADPHRRGDAGNAVTAAACGSLSPDAGYRARIAEVVGLLIAKKVDPNASNERRSPVVCARNVPDPELARILEAAGGEEHITLRSRARQALIALGYLIGGH